MKKNSQDRVAFATSEGRVMVYAPDSPMANHGGYVYRYRLVMAGVLGRPLLRTELVHHTDGDCSNDDPENLEVMTRGGTG